MNLQQYNNSGIGSSSNSSTEFKSYRKNVLIAYKKLNLTSEAMKLKQLGGFHRYRLESVVFIMHIFDPTSILIKVIRVIIILGEKMA